MAKQRIRIFISGRVQGVFFRKSAREKALSLGLKGWIKNLSDGRVEAVFEGDEGSIGKIRKWMREGPPLSRVDFLKENAESFKDEFGSFEIR